MKTAIALAGINIAASILLPGPAAQAEIRIGIAGPLSGSALPVGEQQEVGASAAIRDLNGHGGVLGEEIVATSVDDACDPEQAKAAARQLVSEAVVFVVGHVCSAASIAAGPIYDEAGIVMISPASTNPKVTDEGHGNVFRVIGRDDAQGVVAGDFIADRYPDKRIAIIHDGQAYGLGLAEFTKRELNKRGITEVLFERFLPDQPDYKELIDKLVAAKADVVYTGGYQSDLGIIVRQAKQALPNLQVVGGDSLTSSEFRYIAGDAAEGTYLTFGQDLRLRPEAASVAQSIRGNDAYEPEGYTLYAYAAVQVWAQAAEMAKTAEPAAVMRVLRAGSFDTVLGKIGFDEKGDVTGVSSFVWYRWTGQDYVPVE
jgi:branched-chain amino acid transport system substrate-binding protein